MIKKYFANSKQGFTSNSQYFAGFSLTFVQIYMFLDDTQIITCMDIDDRFPRFIIRAVSLLPNF